MVYLRLKIVFRQMYRQLGCYLKYYLLCSFLWFWHINGLFDSGELGHGPENKQMEGKPAPSRRRSI